MTNSLFNSIQHEWNLAHTSTARQIGRCIKNVNITVAIIKLDLGV